MSSANDFRLHVMVLPEDQADREIAIGFRLQVDWDKQRQMPVENVAGGWMAALELFKTVHIDELRKHPARFFILLIDFDNQEDRWELARTHIPDDLKDRVFIIGPKKEPEDLKRDKLGSLEKIGGDLAKDCREGSTTIWEHEMLKHNADELERLRKHIRPILF